MSEGRTFKTASEQEDWLRTKGKLLAYTTEVLANHLCDEFTTLPAQVEHLVFGYITPVAAEYVRKAIWRETTLSVSQKVQLHIFTLRMYDYVISHYRGRLPNAEQCIDELLDSPIPLADPSFFSRMRRVTPFFDEHFRLENRDHNLDDDQVFTGAFLVQIAQILRPDTGGRGFTIDAQHCARLYQVFEMTAKTVRQLLAD